MSCKLLAGDCSSCSDWGACLFASCVCNDLLCSCSIILKHLNLLSLLCHIFAFMYCLSHSNFVYRAGIFLFPILWGWWVGDHPQGDLFGYRSESTLELFRILAMFWRHVGTYCLNMANSVFFFLWNMVTISYFFPKKSFCRICTAFLLLCHQVVKIHPKNSP
jgi:hypothetical protein